jgi:hypothetical protein
MSYAKRQLIFFIIYTAVGAAAAIIALFSGLNADYRTGAVCGIAGGFGFTGIMGIVMSARLLKNPKKAEKVEIAKTEERTELLRLKTHSAVYTAMIFLISAATLIALLTGYRTISIAFAGLLIIQTVLYVIFARYYSKKL